LLRIAGCNLLRVFRQVPDADRLADLQLALARIWRPDVRTPRSPAHPFNLEGNHGTAGRRKLDDPRVHRDSVSPKPRENAEVSSQGQPNEHAAESPQRREEQIDPGAGFRETNRLGWLRHPSA